MTQSNDYAERRQRQRFMVRASDGSAPFWVALEGQRLPLNDLSLEGFSITSATPASSAAPFPFELRLEGIPDKVRGVAEAVNFIPGEPMGLIGCRFVSVEGEGTERLHEWLTVHVIRSASVRISAKEAEAIVSGPCLI